MKEEKGIELVDYRLTEHVLDEVSIQKSETGGWVVYISSDTGKTRVDFTDKESAIAYSVRCMHLLGRKLSTEEYITYQCGPHAATHVIDISREKVVA